MPVTFTPLGWPGEIVRSGHADTPFGLGDYRIPVGPHRYIIAEADLNDHDQYFVAVVDDAGGTTMSFFPCGHRYVDSWLAVAALVHYFIKELKDT